MQLTRSSTADGPFVLSRIHTRPGDPFDLDAIREDLERLYETGGYERIDMHLSRVEEDYILFIEAIDKSWGPNYLRFGLNLTADLEGESAVDILTSYTMTRLNRRRGELKINARLGENPGVSGEFYQPLDLRQRWFTAVRFQQSIATEQLPVADGIWARYRSDVVLGGLDLGLQVGRYAELRLGVDRGTITSRVRDGSGTTLPYPEEIEADLGGAHLSAVVDQFDNMNFPRHGYFTVLDYQRSRESFGADRDYEHLVAFLGGASSHGRHTLLAVSNLYSALGSDSPEIYTLGGLFRLSGMSPGAVRGHYGGNLSLIYLYRLRDLPIAIGNGLYLGASIEGGNLWDDSADATISDLHYATSISIGVDTIFGPVYLAQGFAEGGDHASYLFIGRSF